MCFPQLQAPNSLLLFFVARWLGLPGFLQLDRGDFARNWPIGTFLLAKRGVEVVPFPQLDRKSEDQFVEIEKLDWDRKDCSKSFF